MPWHIEQRGSQFCVVQSLTRETVPGGCHATQSEAAAQMAALYANEPEASLSAADKLKALLVEAAYGLDRDTPMTLQRFDLTDHAQFVRTLHGYESKLRDAHALTEAEAVGLRTVAGKLVQQQWHDDRIPMSLLGCVDQLYKSIGDDSRALPRTTASLRITQKNDGRIGWILRSSNAFIDKHGHIVSKAALEAAVRIGDMTDFRGPLRIGHIKHADIGFCTKQMLYDRWLFEMGVFVDDAMGLAVKALQRHFGASIGFLHPAEEPSGDPPTFTLAAVFERSLLARQKAANPYTVVALTERI